MLDQENTLGFSVEIQSCLDQEIELFSVLIYEKQPTGDHERGNVVDRSDADRTKKNDWDIAKERAKPVNTLETHKHVGSSMFPKNQHNMYIYIYIYALYIHRIDR